MDSTPKNAKVVIFCGGKGTRMWPVSNIGHPKQFNALLGEKSFFRQTIERVLSGFDAKDIFLSTGKDFADVISKQAPEIAYENLIFEPEMRDNAGAVALSAARINYLFPDSVMIILWGADHIVEKPEVFVKALGHASELAYTTDKIVHVDMKPSFPTIYNGWVKIGKIVRQVNGLTVYEFTKQTEKPDLETARKFYDSGEYLIHSGYMAVKPAFLLELFKKYNPAIYENISRISSAFGTPSEKETLEKYYPQFEKQSIDYALLEKLPEGTQWDIPADMGWIDVGSWELLWHGMPKDSNNNLVIGKAQMIDVKNSLIIAKDNKTVGLIGLDGMIVVDTDHGMLVCPMSQSAQVKPLYKQINNKE